MASYVQFVRRGPRHRFVVVPTLVCLLVCVPLPYSSDRAATSSRQKSGMSGTTRPQTRWEAVDVPQGTSPTPISGDPEGAPSFRLVWLLVWHTSPARRRE